MKTHKLLVLAVASGLFVLGGCGEDSPSLEEDSPSLEGEWAGQLDCSDDDGWMDLDIEIDLEDIGDMEFTGHFEGNGNGAFGGETVSLRLEAGIELELTDDEGGPQPLTASWSNCEVWADGEHEEGDCDEGQGWSWDGEDELTYDEDDCQMSLERAQ